jgi:hypothetical protein
MSQPRRCGQIASTRLRVLGTFHDEFSQSSSRCSADTETSRAGTACALVSFSSSARLNGCGPANTQVTTMFFQGLLRRCHQLTAKSHCQTNHRHDDNNAPPVANALVKWLR